MGLKWCELLEKAKKGHGLLVDFWPLRTNDAAMKAVEPPPQSIEIIAGPSDVIRGMAQAGLISAEAESRILERLGDCAAGSGRIPDLRPGMPIYLEGGIANLIAGCGALRVLAERCRVIITTEEAKSLANELKVMEHDAEVHSWLQALLERVNRGFETGKYRPHYDDRSGQDTQERRELKPDELAIRDAIHFGETIKAPVWCDDRFIGAHSTIGGSPVIDTYDILGHLRSADVINDDYYFDKLQKLRAGNVRYLPVTKAEILHHLRNAPVRDGTVIETPSLSIIRRYVAACMLDKGKLQTPVVDEHGHRHLREMAFPLSIYRVANDVLTDLWKDANEQTEVTDARSGWLWENLCWELPAFLEAFAERYDPEQAMQLVGTSIGQLLTLGFGIPSPMDRQPETSYSPRHRFFAWVESRVLLPRLVNSPHLIDSVVEVILRTLEMSKRSLHRDEKAHGRQSQQVIAHRILMARFVCDLPQTVKEHLNLSDEILTTWGLQQSGPGIVFMGEQFSISDFWAATARAVNKGRATLRGLQPGTKANFRRGANKYVLQVDLRKGNDQRQGTLTDPCLRLMDSDIDFRKKSLASHKEWFDRPEECCLKEIQTIASVESPSERIRALNETQELSAAWYYDRLRARLCERQPVTISEMLPKAPLALAHHLRVSSLDSGVDDWPAAVGMLMHDEGLEESIVRLSCLPIPFPEAVWQQLRALSPDALVNLLKRLESKLVSTVQRIHLIVLMVDFRTAADHILSLAGEQTRALINQASGKDEAEAFLAILNWAHLRLGWLPETQLWRPATRLRTVWLHASRVHQAFSLAGANPVSVRDWFRTNSRELRADALTRSPDLVHDAAYPTNASHFSLVLKGLAFALRNVPDEVLTALNVTPVLSEFVGDETRISRQGYVFCPDVTLRGNLTGSFLGERLDQPLRRMLGADLYSRRFLPAPDQDVRIALASLQQNPSDLLAWTALHLVLGGAPIYSSMKDDFCQVVRLIDFERFPPADLNQAATILLLATRNVINLSRVDLTECLEKQAYQLADLAASSCTKRGTKLTDDEEYIRVGGLLMDSILCLCVKSQDPAITVQSYSDAAANILRRWPELASVIRNSLPFLLQLLPLNAQRNLWPLIFTLRALP